MSAQNKRCPCGSGKKLKNCCAKNDENLAHKLIISDKLKNASAFYKAGLLDEAQSLYEDILKTTPNNKAAIFQSSLIAIYQREYTRAETLLRRAIKLDPKDPIYYSNLGFVLHEDNRPVEAVSILNKAISLRPDYADAHLNRANSLTVQGKIDDAISDYETALKINPDAQRAKANMAYTMNFSPSLSEERIFDAHRTCGNAIESGNRTAIHHNNIPSNRKIKIGYISSDFRDHSVSYFVTPVLEHHNRNKFEIFAYYNHIITDNTTKQLIKISDHWQNIAKLTDQAVTHLIRKDEIDILIDLNGYTAGNRLGVLAQKPSPIQCEWLGYPNTTGLKSMDYWITDETANPTGVTDKFYTESLLRLPGCFICFKPPEVTPEPVEPPSIKNGYMTFGSFNNYAKVSKKMLHIWVQILNSVSESHLILKSACLGNQGQRRLVTDFFVANGIQKERLKLEGYELSRFKHMEMYSSVDIALDTFPYNGTATTCEALWMGVPVITLSGDCHRSRVGKTLLEHANHSELVADSTDTYKRIATQLANDAKRLYNYHSLLRETVKQSTLTDAASFTASLESAYQAIWDEWCKKQPAHYAQ